MYCRICGSREEDAPKWFAELMRGTDQKWVQVYPAKGYQALCRPCAQETPDKVSRQEFETVYWGEDVERVPLSTRKEFYSDYLASTDNLSSYLLSTTSIY